MSYPIENYLNEIQYDPKPVQTNKQWQFNAGQTTGNAGYATAAVSGGSVVINTTVGQITTGSLTTGTLATFTFDLVNNQFTSNPQVFFQVYNGTNTTNAAVDVVSITKGSAGSVNVVFENVSGPALNGTLLIDFQATKL
jgi:hypothetical protein